jgi:hypothetical protein
MTDETLAPPTWHQHMRGPILGLDDLPPVSDTRAAEAPPQSASAREERRGPDSGEEWRQRPPYSGKPVSEIRWQEAMRYAAPLASMAEKLAIQAIDLLARGLSKLARYLEARRQERQQR